MLRFLQQIINCGKDCTCSLTLSPYLQLLSGSIECVNHSEFHCPPHVIQRAANDNWFPAFSSSPSSSSSWPSGPRCSASSTTSAGMQKDALLLLPLSANCFPFMILYPAYSIIYLSEATGRNKLTI